MDTHAVNSGAALRGGLGCGIKLDDIQLVVDQKPAAFVDNSSLIQTLYMQGAGFVALLHFSLQRR